MAKCTHTHTPTVGTHGTPEISPVAVHRVLFTFEANHIVESDCNSNQIAFKSHSSHRKHVDYMYETQLASERASAHAHTHNARP